MSFRPKVVCTCISQGCSKLTHADNGVIKHGQYVSSPTQKTHLLWDERNRRLVESAATNTGFHQPAPTQRKTSSPAVINESVLGSFATLSVSPNTQLSIDVATQDSNYREPNVEDMEKLPMYYDCARFHNVFINMNPATLLVNLKIGLFYVTQQISHDSAAYLLKLDRHLIEIVASYGLDKSSQPRGLNYSERKTLNSFPKDPITVIQHLAIDPDISFLVCCPRFFAMYPTLKAPEECVHSEFRQYFEHANEFQDQFKDNQDTASHAEGESSDSDQENNQFCGADLFYENQGSRKAISCFGCHNLYSWLARFFSRTGIEDALEETAQKSRSPFNDMAAEISDIQDSRAWREFLGPDGQKYTSNSGNLTFGMFIDGINPFGNRQAGKHVSVTFMIMVCLSLPVTLRYRPKNIFVVGIAPGPKEPLLEQTNWILRPLVEQLKCLWNTGTYLSKTYQHSQGRLIRAALLPFFADLPALRCSLGFSGHNTRQMCSYCLIDKKDIQNFDTTSWPPRNLADHRYWANHSRAAENAKDKKKILSDHGVRYSVLLELSYWNVLDCQVVDAMHNLLLGILKWHCRRFWLMSDVIDEDNQPQPVSSRELDELLKDSFKSTSSKPRPASPLSPLFDKSEGVIPFGEMLFGCNTDSSDADFVLGKYWDGDWIPHSTGKVILDKDALSSINQYLRKLHIPSWIGRAIPALGKASFGRLKADEWRNLFTVQLPLVLPAIWDDGDPAQQSLLHNFAHLASFVNLALKRSTNRERVVKYRHHLHEYMKSSLILFPDSPVATNHHMAFHLADCIEKYGPCRAWWSFSMERLMGTILKTTKNNTQGQLEITCLKFFY